MVGQVHVMEDGLEVVAEQKARAGPTEQEARAGPAEQAAKVRLITTLTGLRRPIDLQMTPS